MQNKTFTGIQCWSQERIIQVINKEAVSVVRSDFLATHTPLNSIRYQRQPQDIADKSEQGLFNELLRCNAEDRHTFMVVQGIPGTGKSHLIRWLKERYVAANRENQNDDVVILIERAHCNLQGTLLQIIQSDIFAQTTMQEHKKKLQNATITLSSSTLSDTILDQIRNATNDVELPEEQRPRAFIRKRVKWLLQDVYVRQALQIADGPIDRIKRYLINEQGAGIKEHEIPGFEPKDFLFDLKLLIKIRDEGGYKEVRELAQELHDEENSEYREELATYFNRLLNYAISHTTALTAEDLKQIFNDIRRQLRQQQRNLALFIEDITAFTGIDEGLIDVLATQHTGEGNREFCRLTSVIGITDYYFQQHFPDNMRERVTHRLTLNADKQGTAVSDLLTSSRSTADLTARYLNAMRQPQEIFENWANEGAHPEQLPNACDPCIFKTTCHSAFGFVDLNPSGNNQHHVGLYPFNEVAIWTMYQQIDENSITHTPRTLLTSILSYVLESHGTKIATKEFPPPAKELGSDFKPPSLQNLAHRQMIQAQAEQNALRIESLILFWGSRSIDATVIDNYRMVGGLSEDVFHAFNLPFIEGETTTKKATAISPPPILSLPKTSYPSPPTNQTPITSIPYKEVNTPPVTKSRYTEDINNWSNGAPLQNFEKLGDFLVAFIETAIDWGYYGITSFQVKDRVKRPKMIIENQKGKVTNINDCYIFKRSDNLATVLQALDEMNANYKQVAPDKLGGYLLHLSAWLDEQEEQIVEFVRRPTDQSKEILNLPSMLLANCFFLSCLQGNLAYKNYTPQEILFHVLEDCTNSNEKQWNKALEEADKYHCKTWVSLMKGVNKYNNYVSVCRQALMQILNRPQGGSKNVLFIDTDLALTLLEQLEKKKWQFSPIEAIGSSASPEWIVTYHIYNALEKDLANTIKEDRTKIENYLDELQNLIGSDEPKMTFDGIQAWTKKMELLQKPHNFEMKTNITAGRLQKVKTTFELVAKSSRLKESILRLSEANQTMKEAQEHLQFLKDFFHEVNKQLNQQQQSLVQLQAETAHIHSSDQVNTMYDEVQTLLTKIIQYGEEVKA